MSEKLLLIAAVYVYSINCLIVFNHFVGLGLKGLKLHYQNMGASENDFPTCHDRFKDYLHQRTIFAIS